MAQKNFKIGFAASTFDLFHAGHCLFLKEANSLCSWLAVGLHIDPSIERKEKNKPIQSLKERRIQLEACSYVDAIYEYNTEEELNLLLRILKPNIRFLGSDCKDRDWLTGEQYCGTIHYHDRNHNWSSSELRERIKKS